MSTVFAAKLCAISPQVSATCTTDNVTWKNLALIPLKTNSSAGPSPLFKIAIFKGHLTPFCACAAVNWFLIRRNSFQSWCLWQKSFSIDLTRRLKMVIPTLKDCLVIYKRFKRHILCFKLNTIEKYAFLERGFSKRLETKTIFAP